MRSILEKALIALLNEEREKADALFHEFIIERSRQIHESLRQGEDFVLDESWEKELAVDEMFTEADLFGEDEEEGDDEQINEFEGDEADFDTEASDDASVDADADADVDSDVDSEEDSADDSAEDADVDAEDDVESDESDIETRVDNIEAELQELMAEFDAMVGDGPDAGDSEDADTFADADSDEDFDANADADTDTDADFGGFGGDDEGDDEVEESFDDFLESVTSDLEKVSVKMVDGTEQGGGKITQNKKSPGLQPKLGDRALKGEPVKTKSTEHNGYDREKAPKSAEMPKRQNTKAKAEDGRTKVSKEGDKSAMLNDLKTNKGDDKSIIGSGKVMGKI